MYSIDRHIAIIKPKVHFLNWLKNLSEENSTLTLEDIRQDNTVFMIPSHETAEQDENYIKSIFPDLFDMELEEWILDENHWPKDRTYDLFKQWFDVEFHTIIVDTVESVIEKETFLA